MFRKFTILATLMSVVAFSNVFAKEKKLNPLEVVQKVLADSQNPDNVRPLVGPDFVYVSLNYENKELQKILPWTGTHKGEGYEAIVNTFKGVNTYWKVEKFEPQASFYKGEDVAIFGSFTLRSITLNITKTSPFAIWAKVRNGKMIYMQYMEDTMATTDTFRAGGKVKYKANPAGGEVEI